MRTAKDDCEVPTNILLDHFHLYLSLSVLLRFYYAYGGCMWALLDYDGVPIRYYDYPHEGAVKIEEPKYVIDWNNYEECLL